MGKQKKSFHLSHYDIPIRIFCFIASLMPALWLAYSYYRGDMGINPFATLMNVTGHCTLIFLLLSLLITPLRRWLTWCFRRFPKVKYGKRLSDWNVLIRMRRMLGVYSFFYASIHMWCYLDLELAMIWEEFVYEATSRRFILVGIAAWSILALLSFTSPAIIQKTLGKWWRRIHRLAYVAIIVAIVHYAMEEKPTETDSYYYIVCAFILLAHRVLAITLKAFRRKDDTGMEASRSRSALES